jgi:peptide/nickel transport system permease protein
MAQDTRTLEQPAVRLRSQRERLWNTFTRNRTAVIGLILVILMAVFADDWFIAVFQGREPEPLLAPYDPTKQDTRNRLEPPSKEHRMGLDSFGRDILSRIIYGARVSLLVGVLAVALGGVVGTFLGLFAGYTGGKVEDLIMRFVDVLMAFPSLIMGLMVLALLGPGIPKMIIAIGIMLAPAFVRIVHSTTLGVKGNDYVLAARAIGVSQFRMVRAHILPNILGEAIVLASIYTATAIRIEANLSFIGLGVAPPTPAWGTMIRGGTQNLTTACWATACVILWTPSRIHKTSSGGKKARIFCRALSHLRSTPGTARTCFPLVKSRVSELPAECPLRKKRDLNLRRNHLCRPDLQRASPSLALATQVTPWPPI